MTVLKVLVCLAVVCIVPSLSQRPQRLSFPSQLEVKIALENSDTVDKALRCIEGRECNLPYGRLLRSAGPELITLGRCPARMCTREQEKQARHLIVMIQRKYPRKFFATVTRLANSRRG